MSVFLSCSLHLTVYVCVCSPNYMYRYVVRHCECDMKKNVIFLFFFRISRKIAKELERFVNNDG